MTTPRIVALCAALLVAALALVVTPTRHGPSTAPAVAQIAPPQRGAPMPDRAVAPHKVKVTPADKAKLGNSKPAGVMFWLFSIAMLVGAVFVVTRKNLIAAVLGMVGTFFMIAATYLMLYASFMAVIQILVYAGAIMVLFVFVIMILNRPIEDAGWGQFLLGKIVAGLAVLYLLFRVGNVLYRFVPARPASLEAIKAADFGSTASVGSVLFHDYLFPFEAVSIVLLVAIVGAIAVARPARRRETAEADAGGVEP